MDINETEKELVYKIKSMKQRTLLKEKEEEMFSNAVSMSLIAKFQEATEQYNFCLKTFGEKNDLTKKAQTDLYNAKKEMDLNPIIKEYNSLLKECNEPLHYLQFNLINLFSRGGKHSC